VSLVAAGPVIPNFGQGSACVKGDHTFCSDWVRAHWHDTLEPALVGRERFGGPILHSSAYRDASAYAGRDVVVAGAGSSGADIAVDLAPLARSVHVAIREMPTFTPKVVGGRPYDHRATRLARSERMAGGSCWCT